MATEYIYRICEGCDGDGLNPEESIDENGNPTADGTKMCTKCNGLGKYLWAYKQDELEGEE